MNLTQEFFLGGLASESCKTKQPVHVLYVLFFLETVTNRKTICYVEMLPTVTIQGFYRGRKINWFHRFVSLERKAKGCHPAMHKLILRLRMHDEILLFL